MPHVYEVEKGQHPDYVMTWAALVAALLLSLRIGEPSVPVMTAVFIFTIALVKAYLVVSYSMHLRFEPVFVVGIVAAGLPCLYFLSFGLVRDLVYGPAL